MANLNKVMLIGNLTRDPELKYLQSGTAVAEFGLAINRKYKQGEEWKEDTCFVEVSVWGRTAENCAEYLKKGSSAFVEGRLQYEQWEKDGKKNSKLKVVADAVQFLTQKGGKTEGSGDAVQSNAPVPTAPQSQRQAPSNNNQHKESDEPPF